MLSLIEHSSRVVRLFAMASVFALLGAVFVACGEDEGSDGNGSLDANASGEATKGEDEPGDECSPENECGDKYPPENATYTYTYTVEVVTWSSKSWAGTNGKILMLFRNDKPGENFGKNSGWIKLEVEVLGNDLGHRRISPDLPYFSAREPAHSSSAK